jgi:bifunctional enzyme CysN/CysC
MAWHEGPPLLEWLETVELAPAGAGPLRMAVQWVNRPHADFRGLAGSIVAGRVAVGDGVVVARSGVASCVARIVTADADLPAAQAGDAVTLVLADDVDAARGDLIVAADARPQLARQFAAHMVWLHEDAAMPGRVYQLKCGSFVTTASITALKHVIDMADGTPRPARTLAMNEIGLANLETAAPLAFDPYADNRDTGSFILIDRFSKATVGAGMIEFALRRATNIHTQALSVSPAQRSALKGHGPAVIWFTGLSGSGKSTIANAVEAALAARGVHTTALDGDNIRHGLNKDLGFTEADRVENVRRIAEVGRLMCDAGLVVTCAFISPYRSERQLARDTIGPERFIEVFVNTSIEACMARDPKGLYAKARAGQLKNFTGVDSPYEPPAAADLVIDTTATTAADAAADVIALLATRGIIG